MRFWTIHKESWKSHVVLLVGRILCPLEYLPEEVAHMAKEDQDTVPQVRRDEDGERGVLVVVLLRRRRGESL
jgi:hypothetical protein